MKRFLLLLIISLVAASHAHAATTCITFGLITSFDPATFDRVHTPDAAYNSPEPDISEVPSKYQECLMNSCSTATPVVF
jgi:hypothetical protein